MCWTSEYVLFSFCNSSDEVIVLFSMKCFPLFNWTELLIWYPLLDDEPISQKTLDDEGVSIPVKYIGKCMVLTQLHMLLIFWLTIWNCMHQRFCFGDGASFNYMLSRCQCIHLVVQFMTWWRAFILIQNTWLRCDWDYYIIEVSHEIIFNIVYSNICMYNTKNICMYNKDANFNFNTVFSLQFGIGCIGVFILLLVTLWVAFPKLWGWKFWLDIVLIKGAVKWYMITLKLV